MFLVLILTDTFTTRLANQVAVECGEKTEGIITEWIIIEIILTLTRMVTKSGIPLVHLIIQMVVPMLGMNLFQKLKIEPLDT